VGAVGYNYKYVDGRYSQAPMAQCNVGGGFFSRKKYEYYSVLKLFIGLAMAAFIDWKLIVASAINNARNAAAINIHMLMSIR